MLTSRSHPRLSLSGISTRAGSFRRRTCANKRLLWLVRNCLRVRKPRSTIFERAMWLRTNRLATCAAARMNRKNLRVSALIHLAAQRSLLEPARASWVQLFPLITSRQICKRRLLRCSRQRQKRQPWQSTRRPSCATTSWRRRPKRTMIPQTDVKSTIHSSKTCRRLMIRGMRMLLPFNQLLVLHLKCQLVPLVASRLTARKPSCKLWGISIPTTRGASKIWLRTL